MMNLHESGSKSMKVEINEGCVLLGRIGNRPGLLQCFINHGNELGEVGHIVVSIADILLKNWRGRWLNAQV